MISHMISTYKFLKYFKLHTPYELNIYCLWKIYLCLFRIPKYTLIGKSEEQFPKILSANSFRNVAD